MTVLSHFLKRQARPAAGEQTFCVVSIPHRHHPGDGKKGNSSTADIISGGFDSGVSSFDFIRRGARVHYCFFNTGGREHEIGGREEAHFIWKKYGSSHRVKFFAVPFEDVVGEILEKIDHHLMGVVLKRMMMRAAAKIAEREGIRALVTGESVGQVSSQTITNLPV